MKLDSNGIRSWLTIARTPKKKQFKVRLDRGEKWKQVTNRVNNPWQPRAEKYVLWYLCCGSALVSMKIWIRILTQNFFVNKDPRFWWTKIWRKKIKTAEIKSILSLIKNCNLLIPRFPYRTSKLQEKSSSLQKTWIFITFVGHFGPPGSGSVFLMRIQIQIMPTKMNADPGGSGQRYWKRLKFIHKR